jgi:pyruvate/2-oxoglutarate dehydrogenase complex dihydrolipoamide acyltransferase (E2) component
VIFAPASFHVWKVPMERREERYEARPDARRQLHDYDAATGVRLSFTAFLIHCVARAVEADQLVHAYRRGSRLIVFANVDVKTQIEAAVDGQGIVQSLLIRRANEKSVEDISREIREAPRITAKPRYLGGELRERQLLSLTLSFDHAIVDGAPAARFAGRLTDLIQSADGLPDAAPVAPRPYRPLAWHSTRCGPDRADTRVVPR